MKLLRTFWNDECGAILSAELVMVATLGVIGATVGLATLNEAVNAELVEVAMAIRSLDQSYSVEGQRGCRAWTAGSCYQQQDVEESLAELQGYVDEYDEEFNEHRRRDDDDGRDDRRRDRDDDDDDRRRRFRSDDDERDDRRRERFDDRDRDDRRRERDDDEEGSRIRQRRETSA